MGRRLWQVGHPTDTNPWICRSRTTPAEVRFCKYRTVLAALLLPPAYDGDKRKATLYFKEMADRPLFPLGSPRIGARLKARCIGVSGKDRGASHARAALSAKACFGLPRRPSPGGSSNGIIAKRKSMLGDALFFCRPGGANETGGTSSRRHRPLLPIPAFRLSSWSCRPGGWP